VVLLATGGPRLNRPVVTAMLSLVNPFTVQAVA